MRILISPAKKMRVDADSLPHEDNPLFLAEAERLLHRLRALDDGELRRLWKVSDRLFTRCREDLQRIDLNRAMTPAILSYDGIQYRYMSPGVFSYQEFDYLRERLRILSGFYGMLRPFDAVVPYRLEMQAKLRVDGCDNLYQFWGDKLGAALSSETDWVLNLASEEYAKSVLPHLDRSVRVVRCVFGEMSGGDVVEKGTLCKMARGEMVRFMAERSVRCSSELRAFDRLGYRYEPGLSDEDNLVFLKTRGKTSHAPSADFDTPYALRPSAPRDDAAHA